MRIPIHSLLVGFLGVLLVVGVAFPDVAFAVIGANCSLPPSATCPGPAVNCGAGETCQTPGPGGCNGQCVAGGGVLCSNCDAGDPAGVCAGAGLSCINGKCRANASDCGGGGTSSSGNPLLRPPTPLRLYAPANDVFDTSSDGSSLPYQSLPTNLWGLGPMFYYFNLTFPWLLGIAAGVAILQAIAGGLQIMMSGGSEQKSAGESRLAWALIGLVLVGLTGFILRVLNPIFYQ